MSNAVLYGMSASATSCGNSYAATLPTVNSIGRAVSTRAGYVIGKIVEEIGQFETKTSPTSGDHGDIFSFMMLASSPGVEKIIRVMDFSALDFSLRDAFEEAQMAAGTKGMTVNVEGWQLVATALAILGGSYLFAWDSHKSLLTELNSLRTDMRDDRKSFDDDLKKLISELKTERESDRQQANLNSEAVTAELMKIREAQGATTEALKSLRK
jgi:hypothetical protein